MRQLSHQDLTCISGAGVKQDMSIYTLAISGLSLECQGIMTSMAGVFIGNPGVVKVGLGSIAAGAAMLCGAACGEYSGYSDVTGWYNISQSHGINRLFKLLDKLT